MIEYAFRRIAYGVVVIIVVTIIVFIIMRLLPGNAVALQLQDSGGVSSDEANALMQQFGFDQPIYVQLGQWMLNAVQGNLGSSFYSNEPVIQMFVERVPVTLQLAALSLLFGTFFGLMFGVICVWRRGRPTDGVVRVLAVLSLSIPNFVLAILFLTFFAQFFSWSPPLIYRGPTEDFASWLEQVALPAIALGAIGFGGMTRMTRTSMLEVMSSGYIRTARAKGVKEHVVFLKHVLRSSSIVLFTLMGQALATILGGSIILEQMFSIEGTGLLIYDAVLARDYPVVVACTIFYAAVYVGVIIIVDLMYALLDPRIRYGRR
jgi:peptide/nickel transport system permease protein